MERDPRISEVFYFFEQHTSLETGRTVGRKIGVVQEIILKKHLDSSQKIKDCMLVEALVSGKSGAQHKVEFVLCRPKGVYDVPVGQIVRVPELGNVEVRIANAAKQVAVLSAGNEKGRVRVPLKVDAPLVDRGLKAGLAANGMLLKLSALTEKRARLAVLLSHEVACTIESKRVGAQRFSSSSALGSGIQTIEKAKQASLVAIDCDLQYNESILPQRKRGVGDYLSVVILGNGVHWKKKDLAILGTYVDYVYLIPDRSIIRYAKYVMAKAGKDRDPMVFFMAYFSGLTKTAPDDFAVAPADFEVVAPQGAPPLASVLERHIGKYPVTVF